VEWTALAIVVAWLAVSFAYGYATTRKKVRSAEEWFVAGRKLGLIALWLSLGANIYSSYTFLGLPGLAAREGFTAFAITLYGMLAYVVGFWLIPLMWRNAKSRGWLTIADAFQDLFNSRALGAYAALAMSFWSILYIQLQLQGMGYIIETASYGVIPGTVAVIASFAVLTLEIVLGGFASVAAINVLQGAAMLVVVWLVGLTAPLIAFGGFSEMFKVLSQAQLPPKFHVVPSIRDYVYLYTIILAAPLGFWMWPNRVQNIFAARDEKTVKRNVVLTSFFQISQIAIIVVGLTYLALYYSGKLSLPPGARVYDKAISDKAFMYVTTTLYNPVIVGLAGAGALAASLSTAAAILHTCSALFSRNVALVKDEKKLVLSARLFTIGIAAASLMLALYAPQALIDLLLKGYAGIVQFFPVFVIAVVKPGLIDKYTAALSTGLGMATTLALIYAGIPEATGVYEGFGGLLVNLAVIGLAVVLRKGRRFGSR